MQDIQGTPQSPTQADRVTKGPTTGIGKQILNGLRSHIGG